MFKTKFNIKETNRLFKRFIRHELITGSFYLFVGGAIASILSFLFNLFLARTLTYSDYGIYTSLLALLAIITVPSSIFVVIIVKFATTYFSKKETGKASLLYKRMLLLLGIIALVLFFAIASLSYLIQLYLRISDIRLILLVGIAVSLTYFAVVNTAFLRSLMKFPITAFNLLMGNLSKILIGASLVFLGYGVAGALVGVLFVPLTILILGFLPLSYLLKKKTNNKAIHLDSQEIISYAIPTSIALIALSSFIAMDILLVKHFFNPVLAGFYGGLTIVGKVIYYFTISISAVMFSLVVKRHSKGEEYKNIYYLSLLLVGIPSIIIVVFYYLFPEFFINLFLGGRGYLSIAPFLGLYGIFITIFNLLNITVIFFLSIKKSIVAFLVPVFASLQIILIYIFHDNFYQIIYISIFTTFSLFLILFINFIKSKNE